MEGWSEPLLERLFQPGWEDGVDLGHPLPSECRGPNPVATAAPAPSDRLGERTVIEVTAESAQDKPSPKQRRLHDELEPAMPTDCDQTMDHLHFDVTHSDSQGPANINSRLNGMQKEQRSSIQTCRQLFTSFVPDLTAGSDPEELCEPMVEVCRCHNDELPIL